MSRKVYGKAFRITSAEAKAYRRVDRTVRPNPIGVTSMSAVNGRGAYARSARAVAAGKTRSQRIARAEEVYRNGERKPMVLKNRKSTKRKSSSKRKRVAGTKYFRTKSGRYQNAKGKFVKGPAKAKRRKTTAKRKTTRRKTTAKRTVIRRKKRAVASTPKKRTTRRRRVRRNASVGYSAAYAKGHSRTFKKRKTRKAAAVAAPVKTRRRRRKSTAAVGAAPKRRSSARQKRAGRRLAAYSAAIRSGKSVASARQSALRKVPLKQGDTFKGSARATVKIKGTTVRRNKRRRTEGAFVRNGSSRRKRAGRRLAAYRAALRQGKKKKTAKRAALRKVPLRRGDKFKGSAKAPVTVGGTKVRRNKRRKKVTANKRRRVSAVRRLKTNRRRRVRAVAPNRRRRLKAAVTPNRRRRRKVRRNGNTTMQNRRRRSYRRNGRKGFKLFRRNAFMANLKAVFMTGVFVSTGFIAHRVLTNLLVDKALATTLADNTTFQTWKKPLAGLGVLGIGVAVSGAVAQKRAMELGAGMFASWLQSVIVSGLNAAQKPEWVAQIAGYSNSRAYMLRNGRRRRGLRGMGERNSTSIGPRYTPVGQYSQAAAGTSWTQATAGGRTLGEYYSATNSVQGVGEYFNATGEYFAPQGMKGVGGYEPAGQLAMQASAGVNHVIRDGIRPDSDLDQALDLAEAAAGVGEVPQITRVGQKSQWIPNGPLWAGETAVRDTQATSEISAGILSRQGGNGILSGG